MPNKSGNGSLQSSYYHTSIGGSDADVAMFTNGFVEGISAGSHFKILPLHSNRDSKIQAISTISCSHEKKISSEFNFVIL